MSVGIQSFETVLIFSGKLTEEEYEAKVKQYKKIITGLPAARIRTEKLDKKKLPYKVEDCEHGYYVVFVYETNNDFVEHDLRLILQADDDVIKFLTIEHDGDYTPDEDDGDTEEADCASQSPDKSEQKQPVDVLDIIYGLKD